MTFRVSSTETTPLLRPVSPEPIDQNDLYQPQLESSSSSKAQLNTTSIFLRIAATLYSFVVLGFFTSSLGVILYPISQYYHLNDLHSSFIFLVGPVGYIIAAQCNDFVHSRFGQRGVAILGPVLHILAAVAITTHPPFPLVLVALLVVAMGIGLIDGSWCAWAGSMNNANLVSGLLHGSFSVGAAVGPLCAGSMMVKGREWWEWYYVLVGASILELIILATAFRLENASRYHHFKLTELSSSGNEATTKAIFKHPATWVSAAYFLTYVGIETAISGWIVSFMTRARSASPYLAILSSSGFWVGMAVGRLTLGYVTDRVGVRRATVMYLLIAIFFQLLFTFIRSPDVSVVFMALLGFFMGPMFPSGIVILTRLLPKELHVAAVSFVASLGQVGGAALPFGIGAFVEGLGISVFRWVILVFTGVTLGVWAFFSRLRPKAGASCYEEQSGEEVFDPAARRNSRNR